MVRNVTACWRDKTVTGSGVYVLRARDELFRDVVRVGVAGVDGGAKALRTRLGRHSRRWSGAKEVGTHECQPFDPIRAWELPDWSKEELASAEHCIYRAFAIRFRRRVGGLPDKSLYVVPLDADACVGEALAEIDADLRRIDWFRPAVAGPAAQP